MFNMYCTDVDSHVQLCILKKTFFLVPYWILMCNLPFYYFHFGFDFVLYHQTHKERLVKLSISVRIFHIMINLVKVSFLQTFCCSSLKRVYYVPGCFMSSGISSALA